jgi:hypothetical protein
VEDHVRGFLSATAAILALLAAAAAAAALGQAMKPIPGSVEWAALAALLGLVAPLFSRLVTSSPLRPVAIAAGIVGLAVAILWIGEVAYVVVRAFLAAGPSRSI